MGKRGLLSVGALVCVALLLPVACFSAGAESDSSQLIQAARAARRNGDFAQAGKLYSSAIRDLETAGATINGKVRLRKMPLKCVCSGE